MYPRTTDMEEMRRRCRPITWAFYSYWDSKRLRPDGTRRQMPSRADIDPTEMVPWLPHIQLIDVFHNPRRLVYRLVGETDVSFRGYNPTGRTVEEGMIGRSAEETLRNYELVIDQHLPVYDWAEYVSRSGYLRSQEGLLLPLSDDDKTVNMVLTFAQVDTQA
ncbi:PAS domain-containing protein [Dongia sp.]|uniref:PAS domain-containing protein n=1 Tax=Dongia sp. TaxID=1977262 RepID=UPI0035ADDB77